jgi:hypothetical protein
MRCRLDVGGQRFAVSKATLVARPNTFFEAMFGGRFNTKPEKDGSYFIDRHAMALSEPPTLNFGLLTGVCNVVGLACRRDPTMFRHIVNFMRGHAPKLNFLQPHELELLHEDAMV